jgi:hypothetical protein
MNQHPTDRPVNGDQYANVDPLAAARKMRIATAGDALATAGAEVHGDNSGGVVRAGRSAS